MRIVYFAKHGPHGNQDEEAIAYCLRELGQDVVTVQQSDWRALGRTEGDVLLFHKWFETDLLDKLKHRLHPVCWQFDLLRPPGDRQLAKRLRQILFRLKLCFVTDGDWVRENEAQTPVPLVWLPQGVDERVAGRGQPKPVPWRILFVGGKSICSGRQEWIEKMRQRWGGLLREERKTYRRPLADLIASAEVVVAPDRPGSEYYWSNRAYLMTGFGAFLIHPYYEGLAPQFTENREIVYYRSREELHEKILYYLEHPSERQRIATAALERVWQEHLYRHRVQVMLDKIREHLGLT